MKHDFFSVPFFIDKVELDKIQVIDESLEPTFRSRLKTSLRTNKQVSHETISHISEIIARNIDTLGVKYGEAKIEEIWRNKYETPQDFQDPHIHCYSQWSFIIYEDVVVLVGARRLRRWCTAHRFQACVRCGHWLPVPPQAVAVHGSGHCGR